jgi:hypothetical protein
VVDVAKATLEERFWAKVHFTETCWLWTAATLPNGYGVLGIEHRTVYAHRVAYELLVGPIRDGLQIDHLCRVRHCVNPEHLEPVTQRDNLARGEGPTAINARKSHCPKGHPFEGNTYYDRQGHRRCAECHRAWMRTRRKPISKS